MKNLILISLFTLVTSIFADPNCDEAAKKYVQAIDQGSEMKPVYNVEYVKRRISKKFEIDGEKQKVKIYKVTVEDSYGDYNATYRVGTVSNEASGFECKLQRIVLKDLSITQ